MPGFEVKVADPDDVDEDLGAEYVTIDVPHAVGERVYEEMLDDYMLLSNADARELLAKLKEALDA